MFSNNTFIDDFLKYADEDVIQSICIIPDLSSTIGNREIRNNEKGDEQ